jgi:hypothetical protein
MAICSGNFNEGVHKTIDEWVAYECSKLRRLYDTLGFSARTGIEYFNGVHEIRQVGTVEFLKPSLDWPAPAGG